MAVSVAVAAKPEVEIWRRPKNELFDPRFLFTPSDTFSLGRTVLPQYKTSQTTTDGRRQTYDRRHSVTKVRPIVRSAKNSSQIILVVVREFGRTYGHGGQLGPTPALAISDTPLPSYVR